MSVRERRETLKREGGEDHEPIQLAQPFERIASWTVLAGLAVLWHLPMSVISPCVRS